MKTAFILLGSNCGSGASDIHQARGIEEGAPEIGQT